MRDRGTCVIGGGERRTEKRFGRIRMIHISGGIVKVLGPKPKAPMKPRRLPKNCHITRLLLEGGDLAKAADLAKSRENTQVCGLTPQCLRNYVCAQ